MIGRKVKMFFKLIVHNCDISSTDIVNDNVMIIIPIRLKLTV